jgi:hypothetical protein
VGCGGRSIGRESERLQIVVFETGGRGLGRLVQDRGFVAGVDGDDMEQVDGPSQRAPAARGLTPQ